MYGFITSGDKLEYKIRRKPKGSNKITHITITSIDFK